MSELKVPIHQRRGYWDIWEAEKLVNGMVRLLLRSPHKKFSRISSQISIVDLQTQQLIGEHSAFQPWLHIKITWWYFYTPLCFLVKLVLVAALASVFLKLLTWFKCAYRIENHWCGIMPSYSLENKGERRKCLLYPGTLKMVTFWFLFLLIILQEENDLCH